MITLAYGEFRYLDMLIYTSNAFAWVHLIIWAIDC